jgi:hypothetical protein
MNFWKYFSHSSHNPHAKVHSVPAAALNAFIFNHLFLEYLIKEEKYSNFSATIFCISSLLKFSNPFRFGSNHSKSIHHTQFFILFNILIIKLYI